MEVAFLAPAFVVREAVSVDLNRVKAIVDLSFPRFFRYFASHSVSDLEEPLLVAEAEEGVVGFAKLIEFRVDKTRCGCVLWIAVHPKHRRKGMAYEMTNAGVELLRSRGASFVFASTQRWNKAAQATLRKAGFETIGFLGLALMFGLKVFSFYSSIWYAPGELVYMRDLK